MEPRGAFVETNDGCWPALVEEERFWAAQRVLASRKGTGAALPGRQLYLLSFLATCGVCGAHLAGRPGNVSARRQAVYVCSTTSGCVGVRMVDLDEYVTSVVLGLATKPGVYAALRKAGDDADKEMLAARGEVERLRARLDEWRRSAAKGQTSPASLAVIEAELTVEITAAARRTECAAVPPSLRALVEPGTDVHERWEAMPLPAKRDVIRSLGVVVLDRAARPRARQFDEDRVRILPKGGAG